MSILNAMLAMSLINSPVPKNPDKDIKSNVSQSNETYVYAEDFGAKGDYLNKDGSINPNHTDDSEAIQKALNYASQHGKTLKLKNKHYYVNNLNIPKGNYFFDGAKLVVGNGYSTSQSNINVNPGARIDNLDILATVKYDGRRLLNLNGAVDINKVNVKKAGNTNTNKSLLDSMVYITGDGGKIGNLYTHNSKKHITMYNATNWELGSVNAKNYTRGMYIRQSKNNYIRKYTATGKRKESISKAGNNGLLIEGSQYIHFRDTIIYDAGEHAIRIGGSRNSKYEQGHFTFDRITTRRSGGNGFKVFSGEIDGSPEMVSNINIGDLKVLDSRYNIPSKGMEDNRDGLHLEYCSDVHVNNLIVSSENTNVSSLNGIFMTGAQRVTVENANISNAKLNAVKLDKNRGKVNQIKINHLTAKNNQNGVYINQFGEPMRNIYMHNMYVENYGTSHHAVRVVGSVVRQPVVFDGKVVKGNGRGAFYSNLNNKLIQNNLRTI